jgi:hypothetical protein
VRETLTNQRPLIAKFHQNVITKPFGGQGLTSATAR